MYISEALVQKHQRRGPKQTGKFLTVLRMFPPTVSSHECWVMLTCNVTRRWWMDGAKGQVHYTVWC